MNTENHAFRDAVIDALAFGGKLAVECSSLEPIPKEALKADIEIYAKSSKLIFEWLGAQNVTPAELQCAADGFFKAAKAFGIQRIFYLSSPVGGISSSLYYVEGGDVEGFCEAVRICKLSKTVEDEQKSKAVALICKYGQRRTKIRWHGGCHGG